MHNKAELLKRAREQARLNQVLDQKQKDIVAQYEKSILNGGANEPELRQMMHVILDEYLDCLAVLITIQKQLGIS